MSISAAGNQFIVWELGAGDYIIVGSWDDISMVYVSYKGVCFIHLKDVFPFEQVFQFAN